MCVETLIIAVAKRPNHLLPVGHVLCSALTLQPPECISSNLGMRMSPGVSNVKPRQNRIHAYEKYLRSKL